MELLGSGFDTLLTRGALVALAAASSWLLLVVTSVALEACTRGRVRVARRTGCPPALRVWLLGVFVALLTALTAPAEAAGPGSGGPDGSGTTTTTALDGLALPDRVAGSGKPRTAPSEITVRPGDSLWRIARRLLPGATQSELADAVARLYAANRATIGADPDLVTPGQHLLAPDRPAAPTTTREAR